MTLFDWSNLVISLSGLGLGYTSAHGTIQRWRRRKQLPKLLQEKLFLTELNASVPRQHAYLLESLMIVAAIAGGGLMLYSLPFPPITGAEPLGSFRVLLIGGFVYLFSLSRLSRYWDATKRYDKTMARLDADIRRLQK